MNYNEKISRQVAAVPRSAIREFFELVQGREGVISLGVGEPDFVTPWSVREAAIFSLEQGATSYTSNLGLLRLRSAISAYLEGLCGVRYQANDEILVTVGVSEALDLALRALLNPGDEVIYHEPSYVSYAPGISLAHAVPVAVATLPEEGFTLNPAALEAAITPRTRVLMLNFPTNPTGAVATAEQLAELAEICRRHDLIVIADEIYAELTYDGNEHLSFAAIEGMRERTLLLHGLSKGFAMTGFRLGYACGPAPLIEAMLKIHQYAMLCAPITSQAAAIEALENGCEEVAKMRDSYQQRRDYLVGELNRLGLPCASPGGAFYAFPDIRGSGLTSSEFATRLVETANVAAVPGSAFGASGEGFLRCCYATSFAMLKVAVERLDEFLNEEL